VTESKGESDGEEARGEIVEIAFEIRIRRESLSYKCEYVCLIGRRDATERKYDTPGKYLDTFTHSHPVAKIVGIKIEGFEQRKERVSLRLD
jgi:hypothetical protein